MKNVFSLKKRIMDGYKNNSEILKNVFEYSKDRYIATLKTVINIGDFTMDDAYNLLKESHNELKELLHLVLSEKHSKVE